MALVDHVDDIAFASSLEVDKVFPEEYTGSFTVGASSSSPFLGNVATVSLTHTHGEDVLPVMIFSNNNADWQDAGTMIFASGSIDSHFTASCYTEAGSLVIVAQNFHTSSQTCYYKVVLISDD